MINYEGSVSINDADHYWNGSWCWYVNDRDKVDTYTLRIWIDDDTDTSQIIDEYECEAVSCEGKNTMYPTGHDLFSSTRWKIQRFPVEYVPLGKAELIRLSLSPRQSRMFKGYNSSYLRTLPLLDYALSDGLSNRLSNREGLTLPRRWFDLAEESPDELTPDEELAYNIIDAADGTLIAQMSADEYANYQRQPGEIAISTVLDVNTPRQPMRRYRATAALSMNNEGRLRQVEWEDVAIGIGRVLEIGTPPVMRNMMTLTMAHSKARAAVKQFMFDDDTKVCVPAFDIACITTRGDRNKAIVLRSGALFGHLVREGDEVVFYPTPQLHEDRTVRALLRKSAVRIAENYLTSNIGAAK